MTVGNIARVPVGDLADDDCALFLWAICPMLPDALRVMEAWGFKFKTVAFTWAKTTRSSTDAWLYAPRWHIGMGYWTRANSELCLLGTRGKPKRKAKEVRQLIVAPVREHSRKPDEQYGLIERLCEGPRIELFARHRRRGWRSWGNEL